MQQYNVTSTKIEERVSIFVKRSIKFSDIEKIQVRPIPSLVDEIAIVVIGKESILIPDTEDIFWDLATKFNLDSIFGNDWYAKAEDGQVFESKTPVNVV